MKVLKKFQNTPVNVKVEGERAMLKGVELRPTVDTGIFAVYTGRRGRPRLLAQSQIEKITNANGMSKKHTAKKPVQTKKSSNEKHREMLDKGAAKPAEGKKKVVVTKKKSKK